VKNCERGGVLTPGGERAREKAKKSGWMSKGAFRREKKRGVGKSPRIISGTRKAVIKSHGQKKRIGVGKFSIRELRYRGGGGTWKKIDLTAVQSKEGSEKMYLQNSNRKKVKGSSVNWSFHDE